MAQRITVIYTDDTKPRRYISSTSRRDEVHDNNLLAELTAHPKEAHDFGSVANAKLIIPKIHNPFDRTYKTGSVETVKKSAKRILSGEIN